MISLAVFPASHFLFQMAAYAARVESAWFNSCELSCIFLDGLKVSHATFRLGRSGLAFQVTLETSVLGPALLPFSPAPVTPQ